MNKLTPNPLAKAFASLAAALSLGGCATVTEVRHDLAPQSELHITCIPYGATYTWRDPQQAINIAGTVYTSLPNGGSTDILFMEGTIDNYYINTRARGSRRIQGGLGQPVHAGRVDPLATTVKMDWALGKVDGAFIKKLDTSLDCMLAVGRPAHVPIPHAAYGSSPQF